MKRHVSLLALLLLAAPVLAQQATDDNRWYAGANIGWSSVDEGGVDDDDTGFKIFGGYHVNQWLDGEIGYVDLGKFENGGELEVNGFEASVLGRVPINPEASVFGRVGMFAWDTSGDDLAFADDTGTDPLIGFGADYRFSDMLGVRAEYERFYEVDEADIDLFSLGVVYDF